jgi:hypothetical protein
MTDFHTEVAEPAPRQISDRRGIAAITTDRSLVGLWVVRRAPRAIS